MSQAVKDHLGSTIGEHPEECHQRALREPSPSSGFERLVALSPITPDETLQQKQQQQQQQQLKHQHQLQLQLQLQLQHGWEHTRHIKCQGLVGPRDLSVGPITGLEQRRRIFRHSPGIREWPEEDRCKRQGEGSRWVRRGRRYKGSQNTEEQISCHSIVLDPCQVMGPLCGRRVSEVEFIILGAGARSCILIHPLFQ